MSNYISEYIPEKWKILRLEYKDEYIEYLKKENMKKIHKPKIIKKPVKNHANHVKSKNPEKPVSVLKNKSDDDNQIIELLEDTSRDLMNYDLEFRIQELESKFSKDLSEATFNELKELKKHQNIN